MPDSRFIWIVALLAAAPRGADAADLLSGPVEAAVVRVVDGDTVAVTARIWLDLDLTVNVRIRGIDAPELRGECREEVMLAAAATDRLAEIAGSRVLLSKIGEDKYGGRVLADVASASGGDLGRLMLASGLARPYEGGRRGGWCGVAAVKSD